MQFDGLLCKRKSHKENCNCNLLERYYGRRSYKCGILGCSFHRHGFTTRALRDSHVRHHDHPWKCAVQSCEYAEKGFLSRRMRDEHLDFSHQKAESQPEMLPSNFDIDEMQPLFFDLIRLDKVEAVKGNLKYFDQFTYPVQEELTDLVASSGSASMAQVLCTFRSRVMRFCIIAVNSMNFETLRWFLTKFDFTKTGIPDDIDQLYAALIRSGSLDMLQECKKKFLIPLLQFNSSKYAILPFISATVIVATAGDLEREHLLLSIWATLERKNNTMFREILEFALKVVAKTTCSLVLVKALLEYGADIDPRQLEECGINSLTPLQNAARRNTPQAAELLKFLLYHGADPKHRPRRVRLKICDEKGPRNIAKWIGMSWDELVEMVKLDRARGYCPPEYT